MILLYHKQQKGRKMKEDIKAVLVRENKRLDFLPKHFGQYFLRAEQMIFNLICDLSSDYDGGYWDYFELTNGGFFLQPPSRDEGYNILQWGNGYEGVVSEQAAGIIVTMMVINHLGWKDENFFPYFHKLEEYALNHKEKKEIFSALD